mgnify:CR=1 FL=1
MTLHGYQKQRDRTFSAGLYSYKTFWSEEDQEFVATVREFPSLSWLDRDPKAALAGLKALVKETLEDLRLADEEVPVPLQKRRQRVRQPNRGRRVKRLR